MIKRFCTWLFSFSWIKSHGFVGCVLIALSASVYVYSLAVPNSTINHNFVERVQNWTFDLYQILSPRIPKPESMAARVVIIDVDETSLDTYGQWPWPRTLIAQLVENLRAYGVLVVGFDMVFAEPDRSSPQQLATSLPGLSNAMRDTLKTLPDNDEIFATTIAKGRVVLGEVGEQKHVDVSRLRPKIASYGEKKTSPSAPSLKHILRRYPGAVTNQKKLEDAAAGLGLFSVLPDSDGVYRKVSLLDSIGETEETSAIFPALSLEMIRVALGGGESVFVKINDDGIKSIILKAMGGGLFEIPTDPHGRVWVHYAKYPTGKPPLYISAKSVLEKTVKPEELSGTLALVGTSAVGLKDIRVTPINSQLPGVEVHAQVMETILSSSHLKREATDLWNIPFTHISVSVNLLELFIIVGGSLLIVFLLPRLSAGFTLLVGISIISVLIWAGWYYYLTYPILVDYLYPGATIGIIFICLTYLNYLREEAEKKQIRSAFGHYVSPALLNELAAHPEKLVLGGETRNITLLFSDIRGFTTISERLNAQELTRFINQFLTPMTNVILENRGTVDKYMGDAIMAFWNAPLSDSEHAIHACQSALRMQHAVKELNKRLAEEAAQISTSNAMENRRRSVPIQIGVGINTGDCCVGNMGSDQRFDYSALGDPVNLASRLEGQSKTYGVDIVLGESTVEAIGDNFALIELDLIQVKGKTLPVRIYTLLGESAMRTDAAFLAAKSTMDALLLAFRTQQWKDAGEHANALTAFPALIDLAQLYSARIDEYMKTPPAADWNGVYIATSK